MWNPVLYRHSLSICFCVWEEMKTEMKNVCDKKTPTFPWLTSAPCAVLLLYSKGVFLLVFFSHTLPSRSPFFFLLLLFLFLWHTALSITSPWVLTEVFLTCCPELKSELGYTSGHWLLMEKWENPAHIKLYFHPKKRTCCRFVSFFLQPLPFY